MQICRAGTYSLSFIAAGTVMVVIPSKVLNETQRSSVHLLNMQEVGLLRRVFLGQRQ